jgi:hypothetical protein
MVSSIIEAVADHGLWFVIAILFINILQKKYHHRAANKRIATLILAGAALFLVLAAKAVAAYSLSPLWMLAAVAAAGGGLYRLRQLAFPFRRTCRSSGEPLDLLSFLTRDSNKKPEYEEG